MSGPAQRLPELPPSEPTSSGSRFRRTLVLVMSVQVVTLVLLWLLQQRYSV